MRALGLRAGIGADHTAEAARARVALADALQRTADHGAAAEQLAIAAADAEELGDTHLLAQVLVQQGSPAVDQGERVLARELLARADPLVEQIGGRVVVELLLARGWLEHMSDDPAAGLRNAREAPEQSRALGDGELELRALNAVSGSSSRMGRHDEAEHHLREGMTIADRIGNTARQAMLQARWAQWSTCEPPTSLPLSTRRSSCIRGACASTTVSGWRVGRSPHSAISRRQRSKRAASTTAPVMPMSTSARRALAAWRSTWASASWSTASWPSRTATWWRACDSSAAAAGDPRALSQVDEVERILAWYGISAEEAESGMAVGRSLDLDTVVDELLARPEQ